MKGKFTLVTLCALLLLGAALASVGYSNASRSNGPPLDDISAPGLPVAEAGLAIAEVATLRSTSVDPRSVRRLAVRGGSRFYPATTEAGHRCYLVGVDRGGADHFGAVSCAHAETTFPSEESPVLDLSLQFRDQDMRLTSIERVAGFAADGIAAIRFEDALGAEISSLPVQNNVYAGGKLTAVPSRMVALDQAGVVVHAVDL